MSRKNKINIKYINLGAGKTVTGSCHLLKIYIKDRLYQLILDYGMFQNGTMKMNELYKYNKKDKSINWSEIDGIILSHSHADHVGLVPVAIMQGYDGHIITTAPNIKLSRLILTDSAFIQNKDCERYNKTKEGKRNPIYPIYGQRHVEQALDRFRGYDYNVPIKINEYITITLMPTGHLLGASSILIEARYEEEVERFLYTGDTSANKNMPFTKSPNFKDLKIDHLLSESTYGDRLQKKNNSKTKLKKYIKETCIDNKGQLMIPVFAVGRSSTIIKYLYDIYKENPEFNDIPVYLASPMACMAHRIHGEEDSFNFYNKKCEKDKDIFKWDKIQYIEEYKILEQNCLNNSSKIVLCSSGMISGGYSVAMASSILPHNDSTILFVGYQGLGTIGRNIMNSKHNEVIRIDSKNVKRKCNIDFINLSSHGDYKRIIDMFKTMRYTKIKNIILTHGDEDCINYFKNQLEKEFNSKIHVAEYNKTITL